MELNDRMEFDHVIRVHDDGTVTDEPGVYAPSLFDDELDATGSTDPSGWRLMDGYSGQYGYSGPIMHDSEFIGGGMARDILVTPGLYVALVNYISTDTDDDDADGDRENDIAGWAVAYREV